MTPIQANPKTTYNAAANLCALAPTTASRWSAAGFVGCRHRTDRRSTAEGYCTKAKAKRQADSYSVFPLLLYELDMCLARCTWESTDSGNLFVVQLSSSRVVFSPLACIFYQSLGSPLVFFGGG